MLLISVEKIYGCTSETTEVDFYSIEDGQFKCDKIVYHPPTAEDKEHYADVYKSGTIRRIFRPTTIVFYCDNLMD